MKPSDTSQNIAGPTGFYVLTDSNRKFLSDYSYPRQLKGSFFVLCLQGECKLSIHLSEYKLTRNTLAVAFPGFFIQALEQTADCELVIVQFTHQQHTPSHLFSSTLEITAGLVESPIVKLDMHQTDIIRSYFNTLEKIYNYREIQLTEEQESLFAVQLYLAIGSIRKNETTIEEPNSHNRGDEIVKALIRLVIRDYARERSITYYADQLHLSPQHLSTTVKRKTNKTVTDIISSLVIRDAQAKLKSTELTIQEIAYSLNFPDISFFGKYFKRYTGVSPKQYRNS